MGASFSRKKIELVIWDLDGTLVDSLPFTFDAFNDGLEPFLGRRMPPEELMKHFGPGEYDIVKSLVGEKNVEESFRLVMESMRNTMDKIRVFDGIRETLTALNAVGFKQALFTGRGRPNTEAILKIHGLDQYLPIVVTSDDIAHPKPHPEGVLKACQESGIAPARAIMAGDSPMDLHSARKAGAFGVGCLWDARSPEKAFHEARAAGLISTPQEMIELLKS